MIKCLEIFTRWPTMMICYFRSSFGRCGFVISCFVHLHRTAIPVRYEPVNPCFNISRWQQQTTSLVWSNGRKLLRLESFGYLFSTNLNSLTIFIKKANHPSPFGKSGQICNLLDELYFNPIMP